LALHAGCRRVIPILLEFGAKFRPEMLAIPIEAGYTEIVSLLCESIPDRLGNPDLHLEAVLRQLRNKEPLGSVFISLLKLPQSLGWAVAQKTLDLSGTTVSVSELDQLLQFFANLTTLNLNDMGLRTIPLSIRKFKSSCDIRWQKGNPLDLLPESVVKKPETLWSYLDSLVCRRTHRRTKVPPRPGPRFD
jgi:hypothetical protein